MVRVSKTQQFQDFLETFPGNFCTICPCFEISEFLVEWKAIDRTMDDFKMFAFEELFKGLF